MTLLTCLLFVLYLRAGQAETLSNETVDEQAHPMMNDVIAFSAELSSDAELAPGSPLVFDRVITNAGGWYAGTTGQFVCPDDGLYVFTWSLRKVTASALPGMRCIGSLRSGGVDRKYGPKTNYYSTGWSGVSQMTAVLECTSSPPTAVTITAQPWSEELGSNSLFHEGTSSFSGFKLVAGVAFSVELSEDQTVIPGGRIMFDKVLANYGGYYDATNGLFRCPDDSVYALSVSTHTRNPTTPWSVSRLVMEKVVVMQGPMTYIATEDYDSGSSSITAVLQCTQGLSLYVEAQDAHDFTHNSYGEKLTSFTGFKLYDVTAETVAFTVVLTHNVTFTALGETIPFDEVITNIGSAFNTNTNHFVCPDDACYMFTWTLVSSGSDTARAHLALQMDGSEVRVCATTEQTSSDDTGTSGSSSQSVIVQCQPGSLVRIASYFSESGTCLGGYTSFSGYKLPG